MYKNHNIFILILFAVVSSITFTICYFAPPDIAIHTAILTAVSVIFGFSITSAIAIYSNSKYVEKLKTMEDKKTKLKQNGLQTINSYFYASFYLGIGCILFSVFSLLISELNWLIFSYIITAIEVSLFICNIFITLLLIKALINALIE